MPIHKTATSFSRRHFVNFVVFGIPFGLVCWLGTGKAGQVRLLTLIGTTRVEKANLSRFR